MDPVLKRINWCFIWAVPMFHTMFVGLVLSELCLNLKLSELQIGLVNAIPNIVLPIQLVSAYMVLHKVARKPLFLILGVISRVFMVLVALLLYFDFSLQTKVYSFMLCLLGFHISFAMGVPLWFSWMSDIVPKKQNADFFGDRNVVAFISGMVYVITFGLLLDHMGDVNTSLIWILGVSGCATFVELWVYKDIPSGEVKSEEAPKLNWFIAPFKHFEFTRFVAFGVCFNGAQFLVMPFFFIYFQNIGYSSLWIQSGMALNAVGIALGSKFWAFLEKKINNKGVLLWTGVLKMMVLLLFGCVESSTPIYLLALLFFVDGWAMGGWFTSSFSILTAEMPRKNSSIVMAWFFSIIGLSAFLTSSLSGIWMEYWDHQAIITLLANRNPFQSLCWFAASLLPIGLILFKGYESLRDE